MRRVLKRLLLIVLALIVAFAGWVATLAVTTADPRDAEGWERLPDLPRPRGEFAAVVGARATDCPGEGFCTPVQALLVVGGLSGPGRAVAEVDVYDTAAKAWSEGPDLPAKRHHPGAAGWDGFVYVGGGSISALDWKPERAFWMLAPAADAWERLEDMPEGRMGHQMVALAGKVYVVGGRGDTSNILIYDIAARTWSIGAQMPAPRDHLSVAVVGTRIYAIGGRDDALLARVDVYDTISDSWTDGPSLPVPMSAMAAGATLDGIHVIGGEDPATLGGGVIDRHYHLLPGGTTWEEAPLPIVATHGSAHAVVDGALTIVGGARRQGAFSPISWTGIVQVLTGTTD